VLWAILQQTFLMVFLLGKRPLPLELLLLLVLVAESTPQCASAIQASKDVPALVIIAPWQEDVPALVIIGPWQEDVPALVIIGPWQEDVPAIVIIAPWQEGVYCEVLLLLLGRGGVTWCDGEATSSS
jgi:hypothetical protein